VVKLDQRTSGMFRIAKRGRVKGWNTEQTLQDLKDANQLLPSADARCARKDCVRWTAFEAEGLKSIIPQ
jgi:hypothetical protein